MKPCYVILEYGIADGTENPLNYFPHETFRQSSEHMSQIAGVIRENAKHNFRIVSLPFSKAEDWLGRHKDEVFVLSASVRGFLNGEFLGQFKDDFYMACSAGNSGSEGEGWNAEKDYFTAVGAVGEDYKLKSYSSYGKGFVDYVGVIKNGVTTYTFLGKTYRRRLEGTSFSCPQHATQIMNLMVAYHNKYGEKPNIDLICSIRDKYAIDLLEKGKDLKTGLGVYQYDPSHLGDIDKIRKEKKGVEKRFNTVDEVPSYARPLITEMVVGGVLKGKSENQLDLSEDTIRELVIIDRWIDYKLKKKRT